MSTDTTPDSLQWLDVPGDNEGRFQRRVEPPEPLRGPPNVNYPARDGRPMSDNTLQDQWIDKIKGGLDTMFRDDPRVFVASNLMWYPVKGNNRRRLAPDVMVVFGRPKKYRGSYIQHRERRIPPHVVFEILSPGNRKRVMDFKRKIYEMYGIEEYYVFDPYKIGLEVWLKEGDAFKLIPEASGWVSPRLGIRFELGKDMTIFAPDGRPFLDYVEVARERDELERRSERNRRIAMKQRRIAVRERERAEAQERRAEAQERATAQERERAEAQERATAQERERAEAERERAEALEQRAKDQEQRAEAHQQRAERLAARLRELGLEPDE
jgi:Uma2 family endonuclease